jgi:lipopolysaccharide transport system permease protein
MEWQRYWNIIVYRTYAELKSEAQLNYMGYVWWLLEPLLNTVVFYIILVTVLEQATVGWVSLLLVGAVTWQWFNSALISCAGSIFDAGAMLKQIYLPKAVLPLIAILANTWKFAFVFLLLLVWVLCTGHPPSVAYAALPLLLALELLFIVALGIPLALLMPYFPDGRVALDALLRSLMLVSGILFPVERVPEAYRPLFNLNPMAVLIEGYRHVLLEGRWPDWSRLLYVALWCAVGIGASILLHGRLDRSLVKAIHR